MSKAPSVIGSGSPLAPLFLVHAAWAKAFLTPNARMAIANAPLVDATRGCAVCGHVVLQRGVAEGADFFAVDADKWASLRRDNGVDVEIRRFRHAIAISTVPAPIQVQSVKREKKKKGPTTDSAVPRPPAPPPPSPPMALDLHPAETELFVWDDTEQCAVACRHACGHAVRLCHALGAFSCLTTGELARNEIAARVTLDADTHEWLAAPGSRQGVDLFYWDFGLNMWVLWRAHNTTHTLPDDASVLCDHATGASRACVRKRLAPDEAVDLVKAVKAAHVAAKTKANANAMGTEKGKTMAATQKTINKDKALGKRRRPVDEVAKQGQEAKEADDEGEDTKEEASTSGESVAAMADAADTQKPASTQPDDGRVATAVAVEQTRMGVEDRVAIVRDLFHEFLAFMKTRGPRRGNQ